MPQSMVCRCGFSTHRTGTTEYLTQRVEAGEAKTGGLSVINAAEPVPILSPISRHLNAVYPPIYPTQLCISPWLWFSMNVVIQGWRSHDRGLLPDRKPLA